jgi:hypothetical protein
LISNLLTAGYQYPDGHSVDFYGVEVIQFYVQRFLLYFSDYAIHIRVLYGMILLCILTLIVLFVLFFLKIRRNNRDRRAFEAARADLYDGFYHVLTSDTMSNYEDVEIACNATLDNIKKKYRPEILSRLISEICMDLSRELPSIPNAETLCALIGVKTYYERNLATGHLVLQTLQNVVNMHICVSEGLLAVYINHYNDNVRQMARMCHVISSQADPYHYFISDLENEHGVWRLMMLHRLFAWLWANDRQMPQFLILTENIENEESVRFLIEEVAYWGSEREKAALHTLFLSPNYTYRTAALHAVALLHDASQEQAALDSYDQQPESVRREVLRVLAAINSGKHVDFFVHAYRTSSSKETREVALACLYSYGSAGRYAFEELRGEVLESKTDRVLLDQIDAMAIINQMRML